MNTADRLKEIMDTMNYRQVDILKKCEPLCTKYGIKLGRNDLSQYVTGKVTPGAEKLSLLAQALDVSEAWLLGYDVPRNSKITSDEAWDIEAQKFSDKLSVLQIKENAFLCQLKALGWTCTPKDNGLQPDDSDYEMRYIFKKKDDSFSVSWEDYNSFIEDSEFFFNSRLESLYEKSKISLFPIKNLLKAAHERTDTEVTDEMRKYDDDIMNDEDF